MVAADVGAQGIRQVVIVGGGTAGWMTAAALSRYLQGGQCKIVLVESEEIGTVGVGEATIPSITKFHRSLGLDEGAFLATTGATFKLGIEFVDWLERGDRYFHPFGLLGRDVDGIAFYQIYLRLMAEKRSAELERYAPCSVAAAAGRFGTPQRPIRVPSGGFPHAYHFDATRYAQLLRSYAEQRGVLRLEGRVVDTSLSASGDVDSILLANSEEVAGDLFIDCTGSRALLIGGALDVGYIDWKHYLPCDRAVVAPTANTDEALPYTRATAKGAGWQWRIPLQHRVGNGYVYSGEYSTDEEAEKIFVSGLGGDCLDPPRIIRFRTGRREKFWHRNVVSIGISAGFLEPLESTSIHLIQTGISRILSLFPGRNLHESLRKEYNRSMAQAFDGVRDFVTLHYKLTSRDDTPFWRYVRNMPVPDTLRERIELFRETGRFVRDENELFSQESWITVMLGQGVRPRAYSALADAISIDRLEAAASGIREQIQHAVSALPLSKDYLAAVSRN
ncbi:tryptophan halogenase family protein [Sphingomonas sp. PB1R3]|uniref:tryptophan halogenase family protein n=1 Tax=Sphingomonas flavida TaxID=3096154 RepID=UPI002FC95760